MDTEPIWAQTLLNLPIKDVLLKCRTSKKINNVCKSPEFWRNYIKSNYYFTLNPELNAKESAIRTQRLLHALWSHQLFTTPKTLGFILNFTDPSYDKKFANYFEEQNIVNILSYELPNEQEKDYFIYKLPDFQLEENYQKGKNTNISIENLKKFFNYIETSTIYFTPNGPVEINYDADKAEYLFSLGIKNINLSNSFIWYLLDITNYKEEEMMIKYLL